MAQQQQPNGIIPHPQHLPPQQHPQHHPPPPGPPGGMVMVPPHLAEPHSHVPLPLHHLQHPMHHQPHPSHPLPLPMPQEAPQYNVSPLAAMGPHTQTLDMSNMPLVWGRIPRASEFADQDANKWEDNQALNLYILDYLRRRSFQDAAAMFAKEAGLEVDAQPPIKVPQGLLAEWWAVFWDLYSHRHPKQQDGYGMLNQATYLNGHEYFQNSARENNEVFVADGTVPALVGPGTSGHETDVTYDMFTQRLVASFHGEDRVRQPVQAGPPGYAYRQITAPGATGNPGQPQPPQQQQQQQQGGPMAQGPKPSPPHGAPAPMGPPAQPMPQQGQPQMPPQPQQPQQLPPQQQQHPGMVAPPQGPPPQSTPQQQHTQSQPYQLSHGPVGGPGHAGSPAQPQPSQGPTGPVPPPSGPQVAPPQGPMMLMQPPPGQPGVRIANGSVQVPIRQGQPQQMQQHQQQGQPQPGQPQQQFGQPVPQMMPRYQFQQMPPHMQAQQAQQGHPGAPFGTYMISAPHRGLVRGPGPVSLSIPLNPDHDILENVSRRHGHDRSVDVPMESRERIWQEASEETVRMRANGNAQQAQANQFYPPPPAGGPGQQQPMMQMQMHPQMGQPMQPMQPGQPMTGRMRPGQLGQPQQQQQPQQQGQQQGPPGLDQQGRVMPQAGMMQQGQGVQQSQRMYNMVPGPQDMYAQQAQQTQSLQSLQAQQAAHQHQQAQQAQHPQQAAQQTAQQAAQQAANAAGPSEAMQQRNARPVGRNQQIEQGPDKNPRVVQTLTARQRNAAARAQQTPRGQAARNVPSTPNDSSPADEVTPPNAKRQRRSPASDKKGNANNNGNQPVANFLPQQPSTMQQQQQMQMNAGGLRMPSNGGQMPGALPNTVMPPQGPAQAGRGRMPQGASTVDLTMSAGEPARGRVGGQKRKLESEAGPSGPSTSAQQAAMQQQDQKAAPPAPSQTPTIDGAKANKPSPANANNSSPAINNGGGSKDKTNSPPEKQTPSLVHNGPGSTPSNPNPVTPGQQHMSPHDDFTSFLTAEGIVDMDILTMDMSNFPVDFTSFQTASGMGLTQMSDHDLHIGDHDDVNFADFLNVDPEEREELLIHDEVY